MSKHDDLRMAISHKTGKVFTVELADDVIDIIKDCLMSPDEEMVKAAVTAGRGDGTLGGRFEAEWRAALGTVRRKG